MLSMLVGSQCGVEELVQQLVQQLDMFQLFAVTALSDALVREVMSIQLHKRAHCCCLVDGWAVLCELICVRSTSLPFRHFHLVQQVAITISPCCGLNLLVISNMRAGLL